MALKRLADLAAFADGLRPQLGARLRIVAVMATAGLPEQPGLVLLHDPERAVAAACGAPPSSLLVRPDGHIGWRGRSWREPGLRIHLERMFAPILTA